MEAQYLIGSLNNYELALGDWKIDGAAEDGKQANAIVLKPAIRSQIPQRNFQVLTFGIESQRTITVIIFLKVMYNACRTEYMLLTVFFSKN